MGSETDTDSSGTLSSSSKKSRKHKKLHKQLKKKTEKKHKKLKKSSRRKEKKRSKNESTTICSKETHFLHTKSEKNITVNMDVFGPALPQHLSNIHEETERNQSLVIGPIMPKDLLTKLVPQNLSETNVSAEEKRNEEENLRDFYGPLPITNEIEMTPAQIELEHRALELKMAAMDGSNASTSNQNVREEWMLELPDVGLKSGLAALHNMKRGFHQGKEKPDFSDRSSWTKTPNLTQEKPKSSKEDMLLQTQVLFEKQRDAEQEMIAKKHKKKHKREESLVDIHQKKLRKEEKRRAKELKERGLKPERRPFTRDVDLKLNKIDRNQTKQIVDKAKILNTKFSSGHSKYL